MRKSINKRRHWLIILAAICLVPTSAFAIRINLNATNLPSGFTGPVQIITQVGGYDVATTTSNCIGGDDAETGLYVISSQGLITTTPITLKVNNKTIMDASGNPPSGAPAQSQGSIVDIAKGTTLYIRVWNGTVGKGSKYAQTAKSISWLDTDAFVNWDVSSWTTYLADIPQNVGVTVGSESILRGAGDSQALTLSISSFDDNTTENNNSLNKLQISKDPNFGDLVAGVNDFNAASATCSGTYFTGDSTYYIRAQRGSGFGAAPSTLLTSPVTVIANPGASAKNAVGKYTTLGGTAPVTPHTFNFTEPASDAFAAPTSMCFGSISSNINMASDLAKTINAANTGGVAGFYVTAIYQENTGLYTYFSDANATLVPGTTDFQMVAREPVQVYTSKGGTINL
jgi:hypothetical protein